MDFVIDCSGMSYLGSYQLLQYIHLTVYLLKAFYFLIQFLVSLRRIDKYLNADEIDENAISRNENVKSPVVIENGTFSWTKTLNPTLKNISFQIKKKKLVAIVGRVGAGKSSILSALLGEMEKLEGSVNINGRVAYVPQQAWIQNSTLRQNIIFTNEFNENYYKKVTESCALEPDLKILAAGDMTEIGEKGINLSGGQKQRVSLARAVYSDADIYLLDDPLRFEMTRKLTKVYFKLNRTFILKCCRYTCWPTLIRECNRS